MRAYPKLPIYPLPAGFSPAQEKGTGSETEQQPEKAIIKHSRKTHRKTHKPKNRNILNNHKYSKSIPVFSANGAGCINKIQSIVNNINVLGAGIVTLQETHFKHKGKMNQKLQDFEIFEAIRRKSKGGTLIAIHKSLDPILISEYSDEFELIVVEVKLGNKYVRIMSGYGPQENWKLEEKMPFSMQWKRKL